MDCTKSQTAYPVCDALQLVMRRSESSEVELSLPVERATIGSGQSCTVRVTDLGVRPLHCLISGNGKDVTIRRWADDTLLNGEIFTESPLKEGDRLTIGPVEFVFDLPVETVSTEFDSLPFEGESETTTHDVDTCAENPLKLDDSTQAVKTQRQRARRLLVELRGTRQEMSELKGIAQVLGEELKSLRIERDNLNAQRDELICRLEQLTEELISTRTELSVFQDSQRAGEAQLLGRLDQLEIDIKQRDEEILSLHSDMAQMQEALSRKPVGECESIQLDSLAECQLPETNSPSTEELADQDASPGNSFLETTTVPSTVEELSERDHTNPEGLLPTSKENSSTNIEITEWSVSPDTSSVMAEACENEHQIQSSVECDSLNDQSEVTEPEPEEDIWSQVNAAESLAVSDQIAVHEDSPSEPEPPTSLWDIEKQTQEFGSNCDAVGESENESVDLQHQDSNEFESGTSELEEATAISGDEEDLWGRLHDLRAVASDQLHHEVEEEFDSAETDTISHGTLSEESQEEEPSAEYSQEVTPVEEEVEAASREAEMPVAETPAEDEILAAETLAEVDESGTTSQISTTLFDAPTEKEKPSGGHEEPVSFVERYKHLRDEDGPQDEVAPEPASASQSQPEVVVDEDEESIEEYMAKMMARLRDQSEPVQAEEAAENGNELPEEEVQPQPKVELPPRFPEGPVEFPEEPVVPVPADPLESLDQMKSSVRSEPATDLNALRDLANNSAREAIKISNLKRAREIASSKLLTSTLCALAGAYLLWAADGQINIAGVGGSVAIALSGFWAARNIASLGHAKSKAKNQVDTSSDNDCPIAGIEAHRLQSAI